MEAPHDDPVPEPRDGPPAPRRRRVARVLGWGVALPLAVLIGGGAWLAGTQSGLDAALALAGRATAGALQVEGARGRLLGSLEIDAVAWRSPALELELDRVALAWAPAALLQCRLDIDHLSVERVVLAQAVAEDEPAAAPPAAPASLELPLGVALRRLAVGALVMRELAAPAAAGAAPAAEPATDPAAAGEAAGQAAAALDRAADVATDPALAAEAATEVAAEQGLVFSRLEAALASDGRRHRLERLSVELPQGRARMALALDGAAPFALDGEAAFEGAFAAHPVTLQATLAATLLAPRLRAEARSGDARLHAEAEIETFAAGPLRRIVVHAEGIDPAAFAAGAPAAALSVDAELAAPAGAGLLAGPIRLANARPGAVDTGAIPLEALAANLDWQREQIVLEALDIGLVGGGRIGGRIGWRPPAADTGFGRAIAALELAGLDTRALDGRLPRQIVAGRIDAEADAQRQTARIAVDVGGARIDAEASLAAGASAVAADVAAAARSFTLAARLRGVDPRALRPDLPAARLNLDLDAAGELSDEGLPQTATLALAIPDSSLDGRPLRGEGRLKLAGERLSDVDVDLHLAGNTVLATGAFGAPGDSLALNVDAPALAALGFGLGGRARVEGRIGGTLAAPAGQLALAGEKLALPGALHIGGIDAKARLEAGLDGPFELTLELDRLGSAVRRADGSPPPDWLARARVDARGTRAHHRLDAALATPADAGLADTLRLALEGGLDKDAPPRWSGRLLALDVGGRFPARLQAPAALELGSDRVRLGAAEIAAGDKGHIRLLETAWSPVRSVLRGELGGLVVDLEPPRRDGRARRNADPLTLGARWDLAVGRSLEGEARVFRESGDLRVEGELRTRLGLERLEAVLRARGDRVDLAFEARGSELGSVHGEAGLRASRGADGMWSVPPATPIRGTARLDMPSIAWLGRLAQENVELAGRIAGDFSVSGTLGAPRASGRVEGRELGFTLIDQGLILAGGELDLDFDQEQLRLERLEFVSANRVRPRENRIPFERLTATPGRFSARGRLALASGEGDFGFDADRLPLLQRDDRWMLISGKGSARSTWTSLVLDADFRADAGYLEFAEALPPSLSDDVVVRGRSDAPAEGGAFAVNADVRVGLGDALYLSALGLETRLAGDLRIRLQPGRPLAAVGTIQTVGGGYRGYGQSLSIERGLINFQGPLDAPGLNIVALRKGLEVEAGVAVTGSAKRPQIKLVSEPNVPDPAKLSWIVLGRAPDAASGADLGLLLPAAAALLGGPGGGMTEELSRSLGFDSFSIGQGELNSTTRAASSRVLGSGQTIAGGPSVSGQVLSLGKRLGPDLFLNFEQSLGGAATLVKLTYQVSRRLAVIARGGTDTALDVQYGFSFR